MGFSKQEYWIGLPFPSPRDLPNPGIKPWSPALQADSLQTELPRSPTFITHVYLFTIYLAALGLSMGASVAVAGRLSCSKACGVLVPWAGTEPTFPALQGRFSTTGPPGKSLHFYLNSSELDSHTNCSLLYWHPFPFLECLNFIHVSLYTSRNLLG